MEVYDALATVRDEIQKRMSDLCRLVESHNTIAELCGGEPITVSASVPALPPKANGRAEPEKKPSKASGPCGPRQSRSRFLIPIGKFLLAGKKRPSEISEHVRAVQSQWHEVVMRRNDLFVKEGSGPGNVFWSLTEAGVREFSEAGKV